MSDLVLTNARVIGEAAELHGTVAVVGGRIAEMTTGSSAVHGAIDLGGDLLLPGLVEVHTDNLERHHGPRPGVVWPVASALAAHDAELAAAGITTVLDSISVGEYSGKHERRALLDRSVEAIRAGRATGSLRVDHYLHLRLEVSDGAVVEMFQPHAGDPLLRLCSLMDHTPGQRQWSDIAKFRQFNQGRRHWSDAEMDRIIAERLAGQKLHADPNRAALLAMCRDAGVTLASHDDTTAEHVREAVADGIAISEFPTSVEAARAARDAGMAIVMGAPNIVRGGSHSGNVGAGAMAEAGLLDALASDYVPVSLLQAPFILARRHGMTLPAAVTMVSAAPAAMVGMSDRGRIAPGLRADLVRVSLVDEVPIVRAVWREGQRVF